METDVERMFPKKSPPASMVEEHDSEVMQAADPVPDQRNINVPTADAGRPTGPAPPGQCKFDGTDYPDWLPINPFKKADEPFTFPFPEVKGDPWANAAQMVKEFDDGMCTAWVDEIQNILIFSGLFSAIVTAFAVQTQNMLQPDAAVASVLLLAHLSGQLGNSSSPVNAIAAPFQNESNPIQSIRVNALIYFSLVLSLGTALVGILALQWIRSYRQRVPQTHKERIRIREIRYESLMNWKVPQIISALPLILQASLVIFFAGLADFLQSLNTTVAIIISSLIGTIVLFVVFTMIAPGLSIVNISVRIRSYRLHTFQTLCPYQSPQSWLVVQLVLFLQGIFHRIFPGSQRGLWSTRPLRGMAQAHNWPQLVKARPRYINCDSAESNLIDRHPTVLLGWMLKNFTQDVESFCSLFHCFQTLRHSEMHETMLQLYHGRTKDIDTLIDIHKSTAIIAPLEAGHIYSKYLIGWALRHEYWSHPGIKIYATELILRSATYTLPPDSSDTPCRLVSSRLWEWYNIVNFSNYLPHTASSLASHSRMLTFTSLVSRPALNILKSLRDVDSENVLSWMLMLIGQLPFHARYRDLHIIDDILMVIASRLETWLTTNPDEEITFLPFSGEPNMFSELVNNIWLYSNKCDIVLMHRPHMKVLLDRLANHPKGQRLWAAYSRRNRHNMLAHTYSLAQAWWDNVLVDAFLEHTCATLVYDQERVDRLVKERDNAAVLHGPVTMLDPGTSDHQQDTVLEVDSPNIVTHISPPVSRNLPETNASDTVSPSTSSLAPYSSDAYPSIQPQPTLIDIIVDSVQQ